MAPRPTLEAPDLVTSAKFADQCRIPRPRVRKWIEHSERIIGRKVTPVGNLRYPVYDWNDLALLERAMRQRKRAREATQQAA